MSIQVWFARLRSAADLWDQAREQLASAAASLGEAPVALLGGRVAPHAEAFVETWRAELRRLAMAADDHAAALRDTVTSFSAADRLSAHESRRLRPFADDPDTSERPGASR